MEKGDQETGWIDDSDILRNVESRGVGNGGGYDGLRLGGIDDVPVRGEAANAIRVVEGLGEGEEGEGKKGKQETHRGRDK